MPNNWNIELDLVAMGIATTFNPLGAEPNLLQLAQSVPQLSTLVTAVTAAGIGSVLAGKGPLTVFAPNSESAR